MDIWVIKIFLYSSSVYSCHLFLISSASVQPIPFLSFIVPIFAWNVPLLSLILLKRSLVSPILLFSSLSLHQSLRRAFLSLLAVFGTLHWDGYLSFSPLLFISPVFSAVCTASSDSHFAFFVFLPLGDGFTHSVMSLHSSLFRHSIISNPRYLFLSSTV